MNYILEHLNVFRLVVDFGLTVLIWMVQLIIYPGFMFYKTASLLKWHRYYTPRITIVVAPLMFIQLGVSLYHLIFEFGSLHLIYFLLVSSTWLSTFAYFVPLHQKIETDSDPLFSAKKLTSGNWIRTFQWTLIFIFSLIAFSS